MLPLASCVLFAMRMSRRGEASRHGSAILARAISQHLQSKRAASASRLLYTFPPKRAAICQVCCWLTRFWRHDAESGRSKQAYCRKLPREQAQLACESLLLPCCRQSASTGIVYGDASMRERRQIPTTPHHAFMLYAKAHMHILRKQRRRCGTQPTAELDDRIASSYSLPQCQPYFFRMKS